MSGDPDDDPAETDADTTDTDADPDDTDAADAVFRVLSDERRRLALYYLRDRKSTTVEELATVLSGWLEAREDDPELVTPNERERTLLGLHHVHLPKLADAGFVRYDHDSGEVALDSVPDLLVETLDRSLAQDRLTAEGPTPFGTDRHHREDP